jgi:hypothetical protein
MRLDKEKRQRSGANGGGRCELCARLVREITRHHLVPRSRHKNKRNKKIFDRQDVHERIALLCRPCHRNIHATIGIKELEREYNTLEALAAHPDVRRFTRWIETKPHGVVTSSCSGLRKVNPSATRAFSGQLFADR